MPGPTPDFLVYSCLPEPPNWAHPTANIATRNSVALLRDDSIIVILVSMDVETLRIVLNCTSADVGHSHGHSTFAGDSCNQLSDFALQGSAVCCAFNTGTPSCSSSPTAGILTLTVMMPSAFGSA